ncbi:MAG: nucleotidyltransferase domain-containing protein [Nanoarchaeota archaeon]
MELKAYAYDFVSFLMQNFKSLEDIKEIILFGSVAREEATKKSDVDIFIDVFAETETKKIEAEAQKIVDRFYSSSKFKNYWKSLGVENELSVSVGVLDKWKLKDSMLGSSIILYQKYTPNLKSGKTKGILYWKGIKDNSKRVMLNKNLFGYSHYGKKYLGLVEKYDGEKMGANVLLINLENLNVFLKLFRKFNVGVKIQRVFAYD